MAAETEEIIETLPLPLEQRDRDFFPGEAGRVEVPPGYLFGLSIVAGAMVLLPLIYLAVIGLIGWGTYYYATHATGVFLWDGGGYWRFHWWLFLLYVIPILVGLSLVSFLLRPVFRLPRTEPESVPLSHEDHPLLFRFVGQLCQRMGAPIPSRIDVQMEMGASVRFREGFRSMFGNDIVLTIGLPFVASMDSREFAAIIAHELGHFTQKIGMRLGYVIRSVNRWLARAVYEKSKDPVLFHDENEENGFFVLYGVLAEIGIHITRGLLRLLLNIGDAISSYMSRQMEVHADSWAIEVAGSEAFIATFRKCALLEHCHARFIMELEHQTNPQFPDDFPTYLARLASECSGELQGVIIREAAAAKTQWYHKHPCDAERISHAKAADAPGMMTELEPATHLFGDFAKCATAVTMAVYTRRNRGLPIPYNRLFHVDAEPEAVAETRLEESAVRDYFNGLGLFLRPLLFDAGGLVVTGAAGARQELIAASKLKVESHEVPELCAKLQAIDGQVVQTLQHLAQTQVSGPAAGDTETPAASQSELENNLHALEARERDCGVELEPFEKAAAQRLTLTLGLLRTPAVARSMRQAEALHEEVQGLTHILAKVTGAFPSLLQARREYILLASLLDARSGGSLSAGGPIADSVARVKELLAGVRDALGPVQYPFDPPERHRTLADYARTKEFDPDPAMLACKDAAAHLQALVAVYYRLLARLVQIAKEIEAHS